jgi:hypothetical protein
MSECLALSRIKDYLDMNTRLVRNNLLSINSEGRHTWVQFTSLTEIQFSAHDSIRKTVPTHRALIAPNYPTSLYTQVQYCPLCNIPSSVEIWEKKQETIFMSKLKDFSIHQPLSLWLSRQICMWSPGYVGFVLPAIDAVKYILKSAHKFHDW